MAGPYKYCRAFNPKETLLSIAPLSFNSFAIFFAKFIGMANPKFCESALVKVLIPITLPFESINGPPLFPATRKTVQYDQCTNFHREENTFRLYLRLIAASD